MQLPGAGGLAIRARTNGRRLGEKMQYGKIGTRIANYREDRGYSVDELAQRAGCQPELIQAMEKDEVAPALGYLVKIARALGVRLGTFMDDEISSDPFIVRKQEREKDVAPIGAGDVCSSQSYHSLGKGKADRNMEPFFITLKPCAEGTPELAAHEGEEFIVVVSGKVRLLYGPREYILEQGDSMYYNSVVPHHVACVEGEKAEIYAVVYVPA